MYKYLIGLPIIALMSGCFLLGEGQGWTTSDPWYAKDPRTGLCFAAIQSAGYANVPCTPEVEELIEKRNR